MVSKGTPIFPRLDKEEEVDFIKNQMTKSDKQKGRAAKEEAKKQAQVAQEGVQSAADKKEIKFDTFEKVELKVAEVKNVERVEGADKLLKFTLDAGKEETTQILSGIAKWYPDFEKLIGKKVIIVSNLKPRKMRGQLSQGMLLSVEHDDGNIELVTIGSQFENGATLE
ncbi:Methionine--tRNA ligase [Apilactobacillus kunkeei]|nr:Methionine--tRNA ligase [Apilactobacillus kunkeei]